MKNKIIAFGLLLMATAMDAAPNQVASTAKTVGLYALKAGCLCLVFALGSFYGEFKNQKKHNVTEAETTKRIHEWCAQNGIPTSDQEKQKEALERQSRLNTSFCESFRLKVIACFMEPDHLKTDADGIPVALQNEASRFRQIIGEPAFASYSQHLRCTLENIMAVKSKIPAKA